jgi:hypothetical protein
MAPIVPLASPKKVMSMPIPVLIPLAPPISIAAASHASLVGA